MGCYNIGDIEDTGFNTLTAGCYVIEHSGWLL